MSILELSLGDYGRALTHARQVFEHDQVTQGARALPDLVEAAARAGDRELALEGLERLTERARASGTPWALGVLARAAALVAPDAEAENLYRESIAQVERTYVRTDLARAHLVYGEWLRRRDRRLEARAELQTAYDLFDAMGARLFAERTGKELAATGARARQRSTSTSNELTPQESQIAELAAEGATNAEIATKLFLSANTIDYHLRKVYRKLEVSSRRHLRRVLGESPDLPPVALS